MESRASMIIPALQTFPEQTLKQRITNGEMRHYTQEYPPMYVDCADERPLTQSHQLKRWEAPARHFGAATGVAAVYLAATIASNGHGRARNLINRYSNGLAGLAAE